MKIRPIAGLIFLIALATTLTHSALAANPQNIRLGIEILLSPDYQYLIKNKRVGLITNHTGITNNGERNIPLLQRHTKTLPFQLVALFAPEHGINGNQLASEKIEDTTWEGIPVYSLHGETRRPTPDMLKNIDVLLFDIQDIGSRSYTYIATLFYAMEEAAKRGIPVIVADRPNPINGIMVDGPMLDSEWRSFLGYINIPYCHGMTVGELAHFFNQEYHVGCRLNVIPMEGWRREMTFADTSLHWIPTSPNIPEASTTLYYPMTGIIGELQLVNIGIGYTMPFRLIGAPWINGARLAHALNQQKLPGVLFFPYCYQPFYGRFAKKTCSGLLLTVTDPQLYRPVQTQYMIMGLLKSLHPKEFAAAMEATKKNRTLFHKVNGTELVYKILQANRYPAWPLRQLHEKEREEFLEKRKKYLLY